MLENALKKMKKNNKNKSTGKNKKRVSTKGFAGHKKEEAVVTGSTVYENNGSPKLLKENALLQSIWDGASQNSPSWYIGDLKVILEWDYEKHPVKDRAAHDDSFRAFKDQLIKKADKDKEMKALLSKANEEFARIVDEVLLEMIWEELSKSFAAESKKGAKTNGK